MLLGTLKTVQKFIKYRPPSFTVNTTTPQLCSIISSRACADGTGNNHGGDKVQGTKKILRVYGGIEPKPTRRVGGGGVEHKRTNVVGDTRGIEPKPTNVVGDTRGIEPKGINVVGDAHGIMPKGTNVFGDARGIEPKGTNVVGDTRGIARKGTNVVGDYRGDPDGKAPRIYRRGTMLTLVRLLVPNKHIDRIRGIRDGNIERLQTDFDARVTLTSTPNSRKQILEIYAEKEQCVNLLRACLPLIGDSSYRPNHLAIEFLVRPRQMAGLYGEGGTQIKQFQKESKAQVRIYKDSQDLEEHLDTSGDSVVAVVGRHKDEIVSTVQHLFDILEFARQNARVRDTSRMLKLTGGKDYPGEGMGAPQMTVTDDMAGAIAGYAGETIKSITQESGADIRLREGDSEDKRLVFITGSRDQVNKARTLIQECLDVLKKERRGDRKRQKQHTRLPNPNSILEQKGTTPNPNSQLE